jgi:hypothetical protein
MPDPAEVLLSDGLIRRDGERTRTTPRWQAAMARAALKLQRDGAPWQDVRLPVVAALVERYPDATDEEIVALVEVMAPIEEAELERAWGEAPAPR